MFAIACLASLAYVFSRPAVYVSSARLQIEAPQDSANLLTAAQALTSRALFDRVLQRLSAANPGALQDMLSARPVEGTNVIELRSEGSERELLPQILSVWIELYRQSHLDAYNQSSSAALTEMRGAVQQLQQNLAAKRRDIEAFRKKFDIVSLEREENQAMAQLKGLNTALNEARNREVNAEARFNAMRENLAAGRAVPLPGDKAIIADLEKRAIDLRDKMKDLENDYGPPYLAIDPKYRALGANLTRLEQQIERERQASAQHALQAAEEELASARQSALRLQQELAARKRGGQEFSTRFAEHTALANELRRLEESYDAAKERLAQLEIESKGAGPKVTILSQPSIPDRPLRPDYWRDALLGVAGSGVLGLLAVWFFEFFKRSGTPQPVPAPQPPIIQIAITPNALAEAMLPKLGVSAPRLPEMIAQLPRELSVPEVGALWAAASPDSRLVIAALLGGAPLADTQATSFSSADLEGLIACAAVDAGLANPAEVTSKALRHTYAAYLVRQGARLADIGRLIRDLAPAELREYAHLSPPGPGLPLAQIDPVFPALR